LDGDLWEECVVEPGNFSDPFLDGESVDVEGMGSELERAAPKDEVLTWAAIVVCIFWRSVLLISTLSSISSGKISDQRGFSLVYTEDLIVIAMSASLLWAGGGISIPLKQFRTKLSTLHVTNMRNGEVRHAKNLDHRKRRAFRTVWREDHEPTFRML
jgi:hypothetical protein